jgi:hypothetical protein
MITQEKLEEARKEFLNKRIVLDSHAATINEIEVVDGKLVLTILYIDTQGGLVKMNIPEN